MNTTIVTRFAPSPTGYLHVGGARTALFDWLLARHFGGRFLLRIEDTDLARSTEQACRQLLEDLRWLGLNWDNAELVFQSKRLPVYNTIIDDMLRRGLAYKAYETTEELDAMRREAEKHKRVFIYKRPQLTDEQVRRYEAESRPHVVRFVMAVKDYRFDDLVLGPNQGVPASQVQDFVIRKSDGMPTYHFAVVVDDAEMGITHVLRGQEHLLNTVNHIALQEALGYARPAYLHLPIILNTDGSKMGKRDRDKKIRQQAHMWLKNQKKAPADLATATCLGEDRISDWLADAQKQLDLGEQKQVMAVIGMKEADLPEVLVHDFRKSGYLPEVLLNFLALAGWSPGGDREHMSMDEMVRLFAIDGIGKSNARFDRSKLLSFNTDACAAAPIERLVRGLRDYLSVNADSPLNSADDAALAAVLKMKPGFHIFREIDEQSRFFFVPGDQIAYAADAVEKVLRRQGGADVLRELRPILEALSDWTPAAIEHAVKQYGEGKQLGLGKVAQPLRVAISGGTISPPIFQSLEFLGKARTLTRIDRCLSLV